MALRKVGIHEEKKIVTSYLGGASSLVLGQNYEVDPGTILNVLKRNNITRRTKSDYSDYTVDHEYFDVIDSEAKAYFLGLLFADGNISKNLYIISIGLKISDSYLLQEMSKRLYLSKPKPLDYKIIKLNIYCDHPEAMAILRFHSKHMAESLGRLGCIPKKASSLVLPDLSLTFLPHFLRGYFDGDGSISKGTRGCYVEIASSHDFCNQLYAFLKGKLKINSKIRKRDNFSTLRITQQSSTKVFLDWIYQNSDSSLRMQRKYDRYIEKIKSTEDNYHFNERSKWAPYEDELLRQNLDLSLSALVLIIPSRSYHAIRFRRRMMKSGLR